MQQVASMFDAEIIVTVMFVTVMYVSACSTVTSAQLHIGAEGVEGTQRYQHVGFSARQAEAGTTQRHQGLTLLSFRQSGEHQRRACFCAFEYLSQA